MRLRSGANTVAGALALAGMLALSSPGVQVARAGDGDGVASEIPLVTASSQEDAGSCKVNDDPKPRAQSAVSAKIAERIRREMLSGDEKPIVLNGRGYNYRVVRDPRLELQRIQAEARRQQEQTPATP